MDRRVTPPARYNKITRLFEHVLCAVMLMLALQDMNDNNKLVVCLMELCDFSVFRNKMWHERSVIFAD